MDDCMEWQKRAIGVSDSGFVGDVYDSEIWRKFLRYKNRPFLTEPGNYLVQLNVDWFQVYERQSYSVGAIYAVILNLPRRLRSQRKNICLLGVLPGPSEPSDTLNSVWRQLVQDFLALESGIRMKTFHNPTVGRRISALIVTLASDVPATHKAGGHTGHGATSGCPLCHKVFARELFNGSHRCRFGDFQDITQWLPKTAAERADSIRQWTEATSQAQRKKVERQSGVRPSELDRLPYWDQLPNSGIAVDLMH